MFKKGYKQTAEHKRRIAIANTGKVPSPESIQKGVNTRRERGSYVGINKGLKRTPEQRRKMSLAAKGRIVSLETRKKLSLVARQKGFGKWMVGRTGILSASWKGGLTPIHTKIRTSSEYVRWRKSVFARDDYTCQACGIRGIKLQADHVLPFAFYPDLRFETLNGQTLCVACHKKTPTYCAQTDIFNEPNYCR